MLIILVLKTLLFGRQHIASEIFYIFNLKITFFFFSFQSCYEQEFHEPLPVYDGGVPLEHLITCVPDIDIKLMGPNKNIKIIKYKESKNDESEEGIFYFVSILPFFFYLYSTSIFIMTK